MVVYVAILIVAFVQLATVGFFLWKSYVTCNADEAIVKTGYGGQQVVQRGGIIVLPVLQRYQRVSLAAVPLQIEFDAARPLRFSDGNSEPILITAWIMLDVINGSDAIIEAVETMGASKLAEPEHMQRYYGDVMKQSIQRAAKLAKRDAWFQDLPQIPRGVYEAISSELEDFHRVQRITIASR
ncbi:hypothetical protein [Stieleria varia]|uniref:SPFH domain / Band 7 family protein n=1 Tax=Stieleria varia TaxID=2528005 RepID=A0A5C6B4A0_9BACT|nr:hypothetical protein [Stieleria varia]TWU06382.1 hypothetical protein Pla52n_21030 [Stieleria varia]